MLGCLGIRHRTRVGAQASTRQFHSVTVAHPAVRRTGLIGFDSACDAAGSGPRMQGYLVNAPCKNIVAESKRNDFALAA